LYVYVGDIQVVVVLDLFYMLLFPIEFDVVVLYLAIVDIRPESKRIVVFELEDLLLLMVIVLEEEKKKNVTSQMRSWLVIRLRVG
jgi:hypothetical protein